MQPWVKQGWHSDATFPKLHSSMRRSWLDDKINLKQNVLAHHAEAEHARCHMKLAQDAQQPAIMA
jgi:hypothetical protein